MIVNLMEVPTMSHNQTFTFDYGRKRIEYKLQYTKRRTLAIDVHPDLSVVVTAPHNCSHETIQSKLQRRAAWIVQQQRFFETFLPTLPPRKYVSGESHRYLGRQYRLRVLKGESNCVKLARGQLDVYLVDPIKKTYIKPLVVTWFRQRAQVVFRELFEAIAAKAERHCIRAESFELRRMKNRWGSCTQEGKILLNPELITAPKQCIEYVIIHELCHLKEHNHGPKFYSLLNDLMPDWETRRVKLNRSQL